MSMVVVPASEVGAVVGLTATCCDGVLGRGWAGDSAFIAGCVEDARAMAALGGDVEDLVAAATVFVTCFGGSVTLVSAGSLEVPSALRPMAWATLSSAKVR